jgi:hypothetical protein
MARVAVTADGAVHVVWEEGLNIVHRWRTPALEWQPRNILFYGGSQPAIATDGTSVAVAVVRDASRHNPDDHPEVYVRIWDAGTKSWSGLGPAIDLSADGAQPDLEFSPRDGSLWVAWSDHTYDTGRPYVARLQAGSVTQAHRCGNFDVAMAPSLAIDAEGNAFVARTDMLAEGEQPQVAYAKLPFGGASCTSDEGPPAYQSRVASLAIDEDNFCLAWQQEVGAGDEVILGCRYAGGWIAPNVSNTVPRSVLPRLALDRVMGSMLVWQEMGRRGGVVFRQNVPPPPSGEQFSDADVDALNPDIAYRSGTVHAVWTVRQEGSDTDVRYAEWDVSAPTPTPTRTATEVVTPTATSGTQPTDGAAIFLPLAIQNRR